MTAPLKERLSEYQDRINEAVTFGEVIVLAEELCATLDNLSAALDDLQEKILKMKGSVDDG